MISVGAFVITYGFEHQESSPELYSLGDAITHLRVLRCYPSSHEEPRIEYPAGRTVENPDGLSGDDRAIIRAAGL